MVKESRKERKRKAAEFRSKISSLLSGKVYELRSTNTQVWQIVKELTSFTEFRAINDVNNYHLYRAVLRTVLNDLALIEQAKLEVALEEHNKG